MNIHLWLHVSTADLERASTFKVCALKSWKSEYRLFMVFELIINWRNRPHLLWPTCDSTLSTAFLSIASAVSNIASPNSAPLARIRSDSTAVIFWINSSKREFSDWIFYLGFWPFGRAWPRPGFFMTWAFWPFEPVWQRPGPFLYFGLLALRASLAQARAFLWIGHSDLSGQFGPGPGFFLY